MCCVLYWSMVVNVLYIRFSNLGFDSGLFFFYVMTLVTFSLTLLVGRQEGHLACNKLGIGLLVVTS